MVHVEHGGLAALEQHGFAALECAVQLQAGVDHHRAQPFGVTQQFIGHQLRVDGTAVVQLDEQVVLLVERASDFLSQDVFVEQVLHPDAHPVDLVGVGRADPTAGGADLALTQEAFGDFVQCAVVLGNDVRVRRHLELGDVHPAARERIELFKQHFNVDHNAIADNGRDAGGEDARWQQVQGILLVAHHHGVPGVIAAVELHHIVDSAAEQVGGLAFAFVAPLGANQHDRGHDSPLVGVTLKPIGPQ